jgi:uncharacterized protein YbjT (DUF2867 family)
MIVVTAPTGNIGGQLVQDLLDAGAPVRVVARDPARLAPGVASRVEVVRGTHSDPAVAARAFEGADAVFLLVVADPTAATVDAAYSGFVRPVLGSLAKAGRVVSVSALGRGTAVEGRAGYVTASLAMDDLIAGTGVPYRALCMPSFMENTLRQLGPIRSQGVFYGPSIPDQRLPAVATRDIAAVACRLLLEEGWTGHGEVPVLGAEDITYDEMAATMTEVLGRPVRYEQISIEAYKGMRKGMSEAMAQGLADMAEAKNNGLDLGVTRTPEFTTPTTFRQWCVEVLKPAVEA